jgi:hypothetical protein
MQQQPVWFFGHGIGDARSESQEGLNSVTAFTRMPR